SMPLNRFTNAPIQSRSVARSRNDRIMQAASIPPDVIRQAYNVRTRRCVTCGRAGNSAVDGFDVSQDCPAANVIAALLDSLPLDQIDAAAQQLLQRFGEAEELLERRQVAARIEFNQKIEITALRIKISAACGRAEYLEPPHVIAAAEVGHGVALFGNVAQHGAGSLRCARRRQRQVELARGGTDAEPNLVAVGVEIHDEPRDNLPRFGPWGVLQLDIKTVRLRIVVQVHRSSSRKFRRVTRGLDPRVHHSSQEAFSKMMDGRVKPGHDEQLNLRPNHPPCRLPASSRQKRLCWPARECAGMRTIFCASETAVPTTCAARPCALRMCSTRAAEASSTT